MNVLLLTSHAIAEHDDLDMFTRMGVPTYSIGGAYDEVPFEGKRPALPDAPRFLELEAATNLQREVMAHDYGDPGPNIDWGKARLAPAVVDWADTIIVHHFPEQWIGGNWRLIRDKRVIWRTCGQSDPRLERVMADYVEQGLQVVRYSPKERVAFTALGSFAGEDAMIPFGKDPEEWSGWTGEWATVGNITQHMVQRGDACGYPFWEAATEGLNVTPAGPGSEVMRGGVGSLDYEDMRRYLRDIRVYLYTGTRPASYTLGLIEAAMTGVPVVFMGPEPFGCGDLWDFMPLGTEGPFNQPTGQRGTNRTLWGAREALQYYLDLPEHQVEDASLLTRDKAIKLHGIERIKTEWLEFLGLDYYGTSS